jgi:hypothetical protein
LIKYDSEDFEAIDKDVSGLFFYIRLQKTGYSYYLFLYNAKKTVAIPKRKEERCERRWIE